MPKNRSMQLLQALCLALLLSTGCAARVYYLAAEDMADAQPEAAMEYLKLCLKEEASHAEALALRQQIIEEFPRACLLRARSHFQGGQFAQCVAEYDRLLAFCSMAEIPFSEELALRRKHACKRAAEELQKQASKILGVKEGAEPDVSQLTREAARGAARLLRQARAFGAPLATQELYTKLRAIALEVVLVEPIDNAWADEWPRYGRTLNALALKKLRQRQPEFVEFRQPQSQRVVVRGPRFRLVGRIKTLRSGDSDWREDSYRNSLTVDVYQGEGDQRRKVGQQRIRCGWVIATRRTHFQVELELQLLSTDSAQTALKTWSYKQSDWDESEYLVRRIGDARAYNGPPSISQFPQAPRSPKTMARRAAQAISTDMARDVFTHFNNKPRSGS